MHSSRYSWKTLILQTLACSEGVRQQLQNYFYHLCDERRKNSKRQSSYYHAKKPRRDLLYSVFKPKRKRERKCLMRLRSSWHQHNCELARYIIMTKDELTKHQLTLWLKRCEFCTAKDTLYSTHLPFNDVIEDEQHVLITYPRCRKYYLNLQEQTKPNRTEMRTTTNSLNGNMYNISVGS